MGPRSRAALFALIAILVATACTSHRGAAPPGDTSSPSPSAAATTSTAPSTPATSGPAGLPIRYLIAPHPDDEFAIWSMAQDTAHYPVLIVLTHGEKSSACAGNGLEAGLGERPPSPQPFAGKLTPTCDAERVDSLLAFLGDMAKVDPRWSSMRDDGEQPGGYRLWQGAGASLLLFGFPDGGVTPDDVKGAIAAARGARAHFPTQREGDVVGMGYHNTADKSFVFYDHPDQLAVHDTLTQTDLGLPGAQYVRTYPTDPASAVSESVSSTVFTAATAVSPAPVDPVANPGARRVGALQVDYGWLAFPDAYWFAEDQPVHSFFSRQQDFTKSF
jgi:hypothetical protein